MRKNDQTLWCVCAEVETSKGVWAPDILYTHAKDAYEARCTYVMNVEGKAWKIVAIGPVVGKGMRKEKATGHILL